MDLAKVEEVRIYNIEGSGYPTAEMNKDLKSGWVIVSVKTVENREGVYRNINPAITVFVLGWPRHQQKPGQTHWADPALDGPPSR